MPQSLRGYTDIMHSSDEKLLDCSGQKVSFQDENPRHLWVPNDHVGTKTPVWHLRITVLKDQEARADCPPHIFAFTSLEQLNDATQQIEAAFGETFDLKKCGIETPDFMGGRVNDGRSKNITIEYDSQVAEGGWKVFLDNLKGIEGEWEKPIVSTL